MRVGMNLLLWTTEVGPSHRNLLRQIRDWGFDGVEIPIFSPHPERARDLGLLLDDLGLERTAVTVVPPDANPIHQDPSVRAQALEYLKSVVEACHLAGIHLLAGPMHSPVGLLAGRSRTPEEWGWALEILQQTADLARSSRITLALEFLNRFESYFLNCAKDTVEFITQADRPNLGILYDTYHAHLEEKNVPAAIRTCAGALRHVHVSENDRATPGEGQVRWSETFDTLKDVGYGAGWSSRPSDRRCRNWPPPPASGAACSRRKSTWRGTAWNGSAPTGTANRSRIRGPRIRGQPVSVSPAA